MQSQDFFFSEIFSNNIAAILSAISVIAVISYLVYQAKEKTRFRTQLVNAMANKSNDFQNQMNQVYLHQLIDHHNIRNNAQHPIYKIAITGGPCGGKSTSMEQIKNIFTSKGFRVLCVPEVPTMVVLAGGMILMSKFNSQQRVKFQSLLIRFQMYAEDYFTKLAEMSNQPAIILCDRGTVDPYAYIGKEEFQAVLDAQGWSWVTLRDRRYDRVCFLSSAANGAQQFYSLQNNVARSQGVQLARQLDKKTLEAWTGHPHLTVVPNIKGQSFQDKINRAVTAVSKTVGQQIFDLIYHKFLIKKPIFPEEIKSILSDIQETFLVNNDPKIEEDKLKKRGSNNSYTYQRKLKFKKNDDNYSQQIRKPLTSLQFVTIKEENSDSDYITVSRQRLNFVYNNLSYAIDIYSNILGQDKVYLLRFSSKKGQVDQCIPKFLQIIQNVKGNKDYSLKQIARKNK